MTRPERPFPRLIPLLIALLATAACAPAERQPTTRPAAARAGQADDLPARAAVLRAEDRRTLDDAVLDAASHPAPIVRQAAARALGRIGDGDGLDALARLVGDDVAQVRAEAAFSLGLLGGARAWPHVRAALADDDATVRGHAARIAARVGGPDAIPALIERLDDDEPSVRTLACYALAEAAGAEAAVDPLLTLSHSEEPAVAAAAIWALARYGQRRDAVDVPARQRVRAALREIARSPQPVIRMLAARGLAVPSRSDDAEVLGALTQDPQPLVRAEAIRSLSFPGAPLEPFITPLLGDENEHVLLAAVEGLGRMRGPEIIEALINIVVYDEREWLREVAVRSLGLADSGQAALLANGLSKDESALVRRATAAILVGRTEPESIEVARRLASDAVDDVRFAAIPALGGVPEPLDEALAEVLAQGDPRARAAAARAAGVRLDLAGTTGIETESAWRVIDAVLEGAAGPDDGAVAVAAVAATAKAPPSTATRERLRSALRHPAWAPRQRAALALRAQSDEAADPGPATERALADYLEILRWAAVPRSAIVTVERPGFLPGRFTVRLDTDEAPLASWNFARSATTLPASGLAIDRVVPGRRIEVADFGDGGRRSAYTTREFYPGVVVLPESHADLAADALQILTTGQPHLTARATAVGNVVQNLAGVVALTLPGDRVIRVVVYEGDGTEPLPTLAE